MMTGVKRFWPTAVFLIIVLVIWEALVRGLDIQPWLVPAPSAIWVAFVETRHLLGEHIAKTLSEVVAGLALAILTGILSAAALDFSPSLRRIIYPLLVLSQTIPILALAPLLIIWFGFGLLPKVIVVTLFCFFPIAINTGDGLRAAEPEYIDLFRSMGATRWQIWRHVRLPAALPYFFSGLKIAATYSVTGAVVGEWVGASSGLGIYLLRSSASFKTAQVFTAIAVISLLSILLFIAVFLLERWLTPWRVVKENG